jgi:hypothetical protein
VRIIHRITLNGGPRLAQRLAALGIEGGGAEVFTLEVGEENPHWAEIAAIASEHDAADFVSTRFSSSELAMANRLCVLPGWHFGYPQPEDRYLQLTYDLSAYCPTCGCGAVQKAPFMVKGEPHWGRRGISQLHWVFDEFFARSDAWESVFRPLGIPARPVLDRKTRRPLHSVVQLLCERNSESELEISGHPFKRCLQCQRKKYLPVSRGCFPEFRTPVQSAAVIRTKEWFGDGGSAFQAILISRTVYMAVRESELRGWGYIPQCN